jgi:hypothetical protein
MSLRPRSELRVDPQRRPLLGQDQRATARGREMEAEGRRCANGAVERGRIAGLMSIHDHDRGAIATAHEAALHQLPGSRQDRPVDPRRRCSRPVIPQPIDFEVERPLAELGAVTVVRSGGYRLLAALLPTGLENDVLDPWEYEHRGLIG